MSKKVNCTYPFYFCIGESSNTTTLRWSGATTATGLCPSTTTRLCPSTTTRLCPSTTTRLCPSTTTGLCSPSTTGLWIATSRISTTTTTVLPATPTTNAAAATTDNSSCKWWCTTTINYCNTAWKVRKNVLLLKRWLWCLVLLSTTVISWRSVLWAGETVENHRLVASY